METSHKHTRGLTHLWRATLISLAGLRAAWQHETPFRQEVYVAAIAIPVALFIHTSGIGRALLIGSIMLVFMVELVNSAVEAAVDHTSLERHPLAKRAKDVASAAVFISVINALVVWGLVLFG